MKLWLRVDNSDEDDLIDGLVTAATDYAETYTRRAFITQTIDMFLDCFPANNAPIYLPRSPVSDLVYVKYYDTNGDFTQLIENDVFKMDTSQSIPPRLTVKEGEVWPDTYSEADAVEIRFDAGYGDAATDVPAIAITAVKQLVANWFENRENVIVGMGASEIPFSARSMLDKVRIIEAPVEP